jgi:hypothetical protein
MRSTTWMECWPSIARKGWIPSACERSGIDFMGQADAMDRQNPEPRATLTSCSFRTIAPA